MASLNPLSSPNYGKRPWVDQIGENLKTQLAVTIDSPPVSIFEIPNNLKAEKLEAYVPQRIGLGPNHHFKPELYHKMEQKKLAAAKRVLKPHQIHDFEQEIVAKVKNLVPVIRACYDIHHDADDTMLAWLFAIDGLFLIDQLNSYTNHGFAIEANDLILLENQIPLIVLDEIQKVLNDQESLEPKFRSFCKSRSLFQLSEETSNHFDGVSHHLLDYMYNSITNNEKLVATEAQHLTNAASDAFQNDLKRELVITLIKFARVIPRAQLLHQVIEFVIKHFPRFQEEKRIAEEIKVPSVSKLRKTAHVQFRLSPKNEGIRNINFVPGEVVSYCHLPRITLNADSEIVLRNLVAYEELMAKNSYTGGGYGLELTEYVDFMCGIIDSPKDVKLLREQEIVVGDLSDEEVVTLFNGIGRSGVRMSVESELRRVLDQINMVYESKPRVWIGRIVERQFLASVKVIMAVVTVLSGLLLIREVYLMVYGLDSNLRVTHFLRASLIRLLMLLLRQQGTTPGAHV